MSNTVTFDLCDALALRSALRTTMRDAQRELRRVEREETDHDSKSLRDYADFAHAYFCDAYREAHGLYRDINEQLGLDY